MPGRYTLESEVLPVFRKLVFDKTVLNVTLEY